jgi:hypothetical protein
MARQYPRFLFSNPKDTKSPGPFIVHTLEPQLIAVVTFAEDGGHFVDAVEVFKPATKEKIDQVLYAMHDWYTSIRMKYANLRDDFYIRTSDIAKKVSEVDALVHGRVSISIIYRPKMGARLDVSNDYWSLSLNLSDDDTYESTVEKLKRQFREKYNLDPDWHL